jgi:hypothetical protein
VNEAELPAQIESVELKLKMDATLTVAGVGSQPTEWLKPGAEASIRWRGQPSQEELVTAYLYMHNQMLAPMLEDVITELRQRMVDARRSG